MSDPVVTRNPWDADPRIEPSPALVIRPGEPLPPVFSAPENPNSGGLYPLGRKFSVGDEYEVWAYDTVSGVRLRQDRQIVTRVETAPDRVYINDGQIVVDSMGNSLRHFHYGRVLEYLTPKQMAPAELQVGRKWRAAYVMLESGAAVNPSTIDYRIVSRENVTVPAGTFLAFKVEGRGYAAGNPLEEVIFLVPGLNLPVRFIQRVRSRFTSIPWLIAERQDLVSARQLAMDNTVFR